MALHKELHSDLLLLICNILIKITMTYVWWTIAANKKKNKEIKKKKKKIEELKKSYSEKPHKTIMAHKCQM